MAASHDGRTVLVTGGGRGIGRAIAHTFADAGAAVGVIDLDAATADETAAILTQTGATAAAAAADVADFDDLARAHEQLVTALGPFDVLINNAGVSPKPGGVRTPIHEMSVEEWNGVVGINLNGGFNAVRLVTPSMVAGREGWIVNMASVAGKAYVDIIGAHYSATKAAIIGFTRHLAAELAPHNIKVNAISPGRIDSPMATLVSDEVNAAMRDATPMGRFGAPEEVADMALFLTSDQARFVIGQTVDVAGGWLMT